MANYRGLCYLNQFFGQIGGEDKANVGLSFVEKTVGPALFFNQLLGEECEIVGTIICGDNYFAENVETTTQEVIRIVRDMKVDIVFLGPAFNAGRYGISCGNLAAAIHNQLGLVTVTGMFPENPAADIFRKDTYIVITKNSSVDMKRAVGKMVDIGMRLLKGEPVGSAQTEGYIKRDCILNEQQPKKTASRAIDMALARIHGEPFVTEIAPPVFDVITPPAPMTNMKNATIALVTDGGLIPEHNPDHLKANGSETWGQYNIKELFENPHFVIHSGYDGTWVMENPLRLVPEDVMRELEAEGKIGKFFPDVFVACGNCASIAASKKIGQEIAGKLIEHNIDAVILTST